MRRSTRVPAALVAAACALPVPDVLPPGHRPVVHELVVEASSHFTELDFHAAPIRGLAPPDGFGIHARIVPGEPFAFSSKYGTRIYALAKGATFPEDRAAMAAVAVASGDIPVQATTGVPAISPVERVLTTLRIASVADGRIELQVVGEHEDWDALVPAVVGLTFAVGVAGMIVLARRRKAQPAGAAA